MLFLLVSTSAGAASYSIHNSNVGISFDSTTSKLIVSDEISKKQISPEELFFLTLPDDSIIHSTDFKIENIKNDKDSISITYINNDFSVKVKLNLIKQKYASIDYYISSINKPQDVNKITFFPTKKQSQAPYVNGSVVSSPIIAGSFFMIPKEPFMNTYAYEGTTNLNVELKNPITPNAKQNYTTYFGTFPETNQLRRSVNKFIDAIRPRAYKPYLHYNSWMDIGYFTPYSEKDVLTRMDEWNKEFISSRDVHLDAFLLDDGWDDLTGRWLFGSAFKDGFGKVRDEAKKINSSVGLWLSPWGGYNKPRDERVSHAKEYGFETVDGKFALSGNKYYSSFDERIKYLIKNEHITSFKLDGMGNANSHIQGSHFASDFDASVNLLDDMRSTNKNLFINLTTGTYASPSWLFYADSIWRQGDDINLYGPGTNVQQWITYRDAETYRSIVSKGPLFPLNSLMYHGIVSAKHSYYGLEKRQTDRDFSDQVWSYFATGTQLQELYITPEMLNNNKWDTLASAVKWSHKNTNILVDTHWIGGNPTNLEVYGWASWDKKKSVFALRNPSDKPQTYYLNLDKDLEIPNGNSDRFKIKFIYGENKTIESDYDSPKVITLDPFQLVVLEATPII